MEISVQAKKKLSKEEILKRLKDNKAQLQAKYPIASLALFGSFARGDESDESDIDIMVELSEPMGWDLVDVLEAIERIISERKIDMVTKEGVSNSKIWPYVKDDLIYV